jgi:hypothetical protein
MVPDHEEVDDIIEAIADCLEHADDLGIDRKALIDKAMRRTNYRWGAFSPQLIDLTYEPTPTPKHSGESS